jgi:Divergent InlB B-repeat domain
VRVISRITGAALAAALVATGLVEAWPAVAVAAGPEELPTPALIERATRRGSIDRTRGNLLLAYALGRPEKLPEAYRSDTPWEGTAPLLELQRAQGAMAPGPARSEISEILSAESGPGSCGSSAGFLPNNTTTPHFYVEYGSVGGGLSIGSYTAALETSWTTEVDTFGWAAPPVLQSNPPPGNTYHVRVDGLGPGLYGYVTNAGAHAGLVGNNPNSTWDDADAYASCMVLRNDYSGFLSSPQASLDSTAAHEFNHSIQFGYGSLHGANRPDMAIVEGGTTWIEDEVFDGANDNYFFLWPSFTESMGDYDASWYAYWITFRGLTERYGSGLANGSEQVMQDFWEETSKNSGNNLTAMQTALANRGTNLSDAFHAYAVAVRFNKACGGGYVHPYCLEEGPSYVTARGATSPHGSIANVGGSYSGTIEDNYALNWVQLPTGGEYDVTLTNTSSGGELRVTVVCDSGSALSLDPLPTVVGAGQSVTLDGYSPTGCASVVAVITNQAQTAPNPVVSTSRNYLLSTAFFPLTVAKAGSGDGTVSSTRTGIDCGLDCAQDYPGGLAVALSTSPAQGSAFSGWAGACTGSGTCIVTVDSAKAVTATFTLVFALSVTKNGTGAGNVTSTPSGVDCGADCAESFAAGMTVTLDAVPSTGSSFSGWSGACAGTGTCIVTMNTAASVGAAFLDVSAPPPPLVGDSALARRFHTDDQFWVSWSATEAETYDVRHRSAPYGGDFGEFVSWQLATSETSVVFNGSPGRVYCFSARASDAALNTSEFSEEKCTAIPAGNTALKHRGPWAKRKGSGHYLGAFSVSSSPGANLALMNVQAKRVALVVSKCPGCGTIKVFLGKKLLRTIRLAASSVKKKQLVDVATFNSIRTGTLRVLVTSAGRPVKIEGVGVSRV